MARFNAENTQRARETIALYPHARSALIPLCHLAQEQDGWLTPEAIEHIAELLELEPAEVKGTASFYDMLFLEPVGKYLISVCTNLACMLAGGGELLEHAETSLGVAAGATTEDGLFTVEEVECIALCGSAPCLAVNWRYFGDVTHDGFNQLVGELRAGAHEATVPAHGTLNRVRRTVGLVAAGPPAAEVKGPDRGGIGVVAPGEVAEPPRTGGEGGQV